MGRATYDRAASDWEKVVAAVRYAGGGHVAIPALDLRLIFHGYQQLKSEREKALDVLGAWQRQGLIDNLAVLNMQLALGVIDQEQYDYQARDARAPQAVSAERFFVDTSREGCVDHIPVASGSCRECAKAQGVAL